MLIDTDRLESLDPSSKDLLLNDQEFHYLKRVLRLRNSNVINIVDGMGNLWEGVFHGNKTIFLTTALCSPVINETRSRQPVIGLSVVVPKRGFEEILRMGCELGVDIVQP